MKNDFNRPGFEFTYNNRRLGKSRDIYPETMKALPGTKHNEDEYPMYVVCGKCGSYMDYIRGETGVLDGKWLCSTCGVGVREMTAYRQLERENEAFLKEIGMEDDY